jgi:hypothetical protein
MVQWLPVVLGVLRAIGQRFRNKIIKAKPYIEDLMSLEEKHGDQRLWSSVATGSREGIGVNLSAEQVAQLQEFKEIFDRRVKRPLSKVAKHLNDEEVSAMLDALFGEDEDD